MLIDGNPADQIRVTPSDMRRAAAAWEDAGAQVKSANPVDRVAEVSTAMPGSAAARQATMLANDLHDRFKSWFEGATEQADALRKATREYETADVQAADEGRKQSSVIAHGFQGGSSAHRVSRGPAVFDQSESTRERFTYLDKRMGGDDR